MTPPTRLNRRFFVQAAAVAFGACFALTSFAQDSGKKKVLFLTKSSGFQHSVVQRKAEDPKAAAHAEKHLTEFAGAKGYDVTFTKDADVFNDPKTYETYQVIAFYTTGDLTKPSDKFGSKREGNRNVPDPTKLLHTEKPMSAEGKALFLKAIEDGKVGFLGFHCASDTFHTPKKFSDELMYSADGKLNEEVDPFIKMIGGEFSGHGSQQKSTKRVATKNFPGLDGIKDFDLVEEWYGLINLAPDMHVILVQDTTTMKTDAQGKRERDYQRPPYPGTWAKMHGKGRVFYTSMGHREDVWTNPIFQDILTGGIAWALGDAKADVTPNLAQVAPKWADNPPFPPPVPAVAAKP